jgi:hypothetical protein
MKTLLILTILLSLSLLSRSQNRDLNSVSKKLQGEWIYDYYETTNDKGVVVNTFYYNHDSTGHDIGLVIHKNRVDEFFDPIDFPGDSTVYSGSGEWTVENDNNKIIIDFNCSGIILCGLYEFISINSKELILKHCSDEYGLESCQVTHFKRRK